MSPNFKIHPSRSHVKLILKLSGDFDGSSAFELINTLTENRGEVRKIIIHTDGLSSIHPFGARVFKKNCFLHSQTTPLIMAGKYGQELAPDDIAI